MKTFKAWLTTIAALLFSLTANAYDFVDDGIYYNITSSTDLTVEVTYERKGISVISGYRGAVTIPPTVSYDGNIYSVTTIGNSAFYDSDLTSIAIPESVTSIGDCAFEYCSSLTSIIIPKSVTSIGYSAFSGCSSLTAITIPESVMSIGYYAFSGCGSLTSITIPKSVTSIEFYTFSNCSSLTSATIPESVTSIGEGAFSGCSSLTAITIPGNVSSIGNYAFKGCSSLVCIAILEGVTSIGSGAFEGCTSLTSTTIPESVTSIGEKAFYRCTGELIVNCNIPSNAFSDTRFTKVALGDRITSIGNGAFSGNTNLTSIVIPGSVTSIGYRPFYGCNLKTAFWEGVTLPYNFVNVEALINYTANSDYASLSNFKVYPMLGSMFEVDGVKYVPTSMSERTCDVVDYDCNRTEESVEIGATVSYRNVAFTINEINDYTFYGNKYIKEISLASQGRIGANALANCTELTSVNLTEGVTSVGAYAFRGCNKLSSFVLPASVSSVGNSMLANCNALEYIAVVKGNAKYDSRNNCNAIIETESNKLVAACNQTVIPESATAIGDYAFSGCGEVTSVNIHENISSIGDYAFSGCSSLADVTIEDRTEVLTLGSNGNKGLFADCPLDSVYIGGKISYDTSSSKGYSPFSDNTTLRAVTITDKEETIYPYEFYNCSSLENLTIGDGVTSIGDYAFSNCSSLENFSFGCSMKTIGANAFLGCSKMKEISSSAVNPPVCGANALNDVDKWSCTLYVPVGYMAAYQSADQWKEFLFMEDIIPIKRYAMTYMVNDTIVYHVDSLAYEEAIVLPKTPTKEGHTFNSWKGLPETMPIHDVTVNALFTINKYVLSYVVDGEVNMADSITYGDSIVVIAPLEREGHTFSGWIGVPETMPAKDTTIVGTFVANSYLLTYRIDSDTIHSDSVAYGSEITMLEAPVKVGYAFDGWDQVLTMMPAEDVVINGSYTRLPIENYIISDSDESFTLEKDLLCNKITYTRTFNNTNWQALYLPFEIPVTEEFLANFEVADLNDVRQYDRDDDGVKDETVIEAFKVKRGMLEANYPYLIRAREVGEKTITVTDAILYATEENSIDCSSVREKFTFTGTYSRLSSEELPQGEGYYALSGGVWQPVAEGASLGAFRFYLKVDSRNSLNAAQGNAIRMRIIGEDGEEDDATGIDTPEFKNQKSELIFDLQGRRVENPTKGVYIVNGVKRVF